MMIEFDLPDKLIPEVNEYMEYRGVKLDDALRELLLRGLTWSRQYYR